MVEVDINRLGRRPSDGSDDFAPFYIKGRDEANLQAMEQELEAMYGSEPPETPDQTAGQQKDQEDKEGWLSRQVKGMYRPYVHGFMRGTQGFFEFLDKAAQLVTNAMGEVELKDKSGKIHKITFNKPEVFKALAEMAEPPADLEPQGFAEKLISGMTQAITELPKYMITPGGPMVSMGTVGAVEATGRPTKEVAEEALKGALLGKALEYTNMLRPMKRIPAMFGLGAGQAAAEAKAKGEELSPEQLAISGTTMAALAALAGPGKEIEFKRKAAIVEGAEKAAAEAEKEAKANEVKASEPAYGRATEILHNQGQDPARYVVVDIQDLAPSHLPEKGFTRNPRYPENVQERQYETDKAEQAKVIKNAQTYDPAYTVNTDPTLVNGPPAVTREGVVLGGNSRVMTLQEVYRNNPEAAQKYRDALEMHAQDFGIDPAEIQKFRHPVLVRVVDSSIQDLGDFQRRARLYNEPPTQAMAGQAEGVSKARLLSEETMDQVVRGLEEFGTLREYMGNRASRDMIAGFYRDGVIEPVEANKYIDSNTGLLTEEGKRLAEQVIRGRVFEDAELLSTASREGLKKLDLSLPALMRLKARGDKWDITPKLAEALRTYTKMKAEGFKSVEDFLAQGRMFEEEPISRDPEAMALLRALSERRPTELRDAFDDMARAAAADIPNQMSFAFYEPERPEQAFSRIFGVKDKSVDEILADWLRTTEVEQKPLPQEVKTQLRKGAVEGKSPQTEPETVLMGGPTGAGKTSLVNEMLAGKEPDFVVADTDHYAKRAGVLDERPAYHEDLSQLTDSIAREAIKKKYNVIYDSLLTNFGKARHYIEETLKNNGKATILFVHVDPETSMVRAIKRYMGQDSPRKVPVEVIEKGYNRALPTFIELWKRYKDNPKVDFRLYDNSVDGRPHELVFKKTGKQVDIKNEKLFDKLMGIDYIAIEGGEKYERSQGPKNLQQALTQGSKIAQGSLRSYYLTEGNRRRIRQRLGRSDSESRPELRSEETPAPYYSLTPPAPESPYEKAQKEYPDDPAKVEEQLTLWHRNAQLSLFEDLEAPREVSSAAGKVDRAGGVSTLALGIRQELAKQGRVDLRGKEVRSAEDLATLAQVYRDPRFETLRIFYIKDGKIVAHEGMTSRLPGMAIPFSSRPERDVYLIKERMRRLGADGYYLLHNHPSGEPSPSVEDLVFTSKMAGDVPGFLGHIIIDSGRYVEIRNVAPVKGQVTLEHFEKAVPGLPPDWVDPLLQPAIPHPLLGQKVLTPEDVARLGRQIRNDEAYGVLIYRSRGNVRAIQEVPIGLLKKGRPAADYIRGRARAFGAQDVVAYIRSGLRLPREVELDLIRFNALLDVVYESKGSHIGPPRPLSAKEQVVPGEIRPRAAYLGREVRDYPIYRVAEDPQRQERPCLVDEPAPYGRPEEILFIRPKEADELKYAGNINLARIQAPEDIKAVIENVAERYAADMNIARRGRISHEKTRELADELGMTVEQLLARRQGQAFNAEEAVAARNLLVSSATRVRALAQKIRDGEATDLEKLEFQKALATHQAVQAQVAGLTAEAGRALNSFKILAEAKAANLADIERYLEAATGGEHSLREVAEKIADLDETAKITTTVRQMQKATRWDMFLEAWINGLLSNPVTHTTNTLSNSLVALWQIPERFLAAGFSRMLRGDVTAGEALAQIHGMIEGAKDGFRLAWEAFKKGESITDPLGKIEAARYRAISSENLELAGDLARAVDLLGTAIRTPGRFLTAEDEFFKAVGYRMELRARAYRQAAAEGLSGKAMAERIQSIIADPPEDIHMAAVDAARYQTFTRQLEGISADIQRIAAKHPALRLIIPFVRTPANIARFAFERTPLAPISRQVRADIMAGGPARDLALARIALGSLVMAVVGTLAAEGLITGQGPVDRSMKATLRRIGWQPYSIKVGDKYYSYTRLEPLGALFGLAADAAEIIGQLDELDADKLAGAVSMSISRNITSKTYLRGITEFINAISDPDRYMNDYIQRLVATAVPAGVAQIERITDPVYRDAHSVLEEMRSRIPGYSKDLPPRRNLWGRPIVLGGGLGPDIMSPIYTSEEKIEPVDQVILDNEIHVSMPGHTIHGVPLTPQEYSRFVELAGNELKDPATGLGCLEYLNKLVKSPEFKAMSDGPDGMKAKTIKNVIESYREMARERMLEEFPELHRLVVEYMFEKQRALGGT